MGRIPGKAFRELREYHSKGNISKPKGRLPEARNLTDAAKSIKRWLDDFFNQRPASPSAGAMNVIKNTSGDAYETPSGTAFLLNSPHINNHEAPRAATDGQVVDEPPHKEAADIVTGAYIKSEDNTETDTEAEAKPKKQ